MTETNYKPFGILSIAAGFMAIFGVIGVMPVFFISPIGLISGIIAVRKGHKTLGWIGIGLSIFAVVVVMVLLAMGGWLSDNGTSD